MVRPALVVGALAIFGIADAGPSGKVVRVERSSGRPKGNPRVCGVSAGDGQAFCFGAKPESGEMITVVDSRHVVAMLRVESATEQGMGCAQGHGRVWMVQTKVESGDMSSGNSDPETFGLLDTQVDPRNAHIVKNAPPPQQRQGQTDTVIAIDANGDNQPDLEFLQMKCDDSGNPTSGGASFCIELWYAAGHHFELLRTDRFQSSCY